MIGKSDEKVRYVHWLNVLGLRVSMKKEGRKPVGYSSIHLQFRQNLEVTGQLLTPDALFLK
jgi:hypothetical protein